MVYWRNGGKREISGNVKLIFASNLSREMVLCLVSFSPYRNDRTLVENYPLFDISSEPGFLYIMIKFKYQIPVQNPGQLLYYEN